MSARVAAVAALVAAVASAGPAAAQSPDRAAPVGRVEAFRHAFKRGATVSVLPVSNFARPPYARLRILFSRWFP